MLRTDYEGESFTHRDLWEVVALQTEAAQQTENGSFYPNLIAMVFAFHTLEAYQNYVGLKLAPEVWGDEWNYFSKPPYHGFKGRLRKVFELVGLDWSVDQRPLITVLNLKGLRDFIAHGKTEVVTGSVTHEDETMPPYVPSTLHGSVDSNKRSIAVSDVEELIESIHTRARPKVADVWFGSSALRGPSGYRSRSTQSI